jgi:cellulose biosynthesis protein BcsQ
MTESTAEPYAPAVPSAWLRSDLTVVRNVINLMIRKGGGGKTTFARLLADALARFGLNVLVLDMDSQGNASLAFDRTVTLSQTGVSKLGNQPIMEPDVLTIVEVLASGAPGVLSAAVSRAGWEYDLDEPFHRGGPLFPGRIGSIGVVPAYTGLDSLISAFTSPSDLERLARTLLEPAGDGSPAPHRMWDVVLIDNPPSGSNVHVMSGRASKKALLIPNLATYAADSIPKTVGLIDDINSEYKHDLEILGIVLNNVDGYTPGRELRRVSQREILAELEAAHASGDRRYRAPIYPGVVPSLESVIEDTVRYRAPVSAFLANAEKKTAARRLCQAAEINALRILHDIEHPEAQAIYPAWLAAWPDDMAPEVRKVA